MSRTPAECGTDAGYQRHRRESEQACDPCLSAHNDAAKQRWQARPKPEVTGRQHFLARSRALARLAQLMPQQFAAFYREELAEVLAGAS